MIWALPENIADALPLEAALIEKLRRTILDSIESYGYQLVLPPLLEYLDSLLVGSGEDLALRTFKLVDQSSGKTLGIRADIAPQIARIDAHILNNNGISRLCYCDSVLHTNPVHVYAGREPIQIGAELYGSKSYQADVEVITLLLNILQLSTVPVSKLVLGHVEIISAIIETADINENIEQQILLALQQKDLAYLAEICVNLPRKCVDALTNLLKLHGNANETISKARNLLPNIAKINNALDTLENVANNLQDFPLTIDLSDCRSYYYHNGVYFAVYTNNYPVAIAQGGRYDGLGQAFGRYRPATGFSLDLRCLATISATLLNNDPPIIINLNEIPPDLKASARQQIKQLRQQGNVVIELIEDEKIELSYQNWQVLKYHNQQWKIFTNND